MSEYENYVEKMKNLKPHKKEKDPSGLEALKEINKVIPYAHITEEYKIIEKELKAFEIIKEKPQATLWLIQVCDKEMEYEDMISLFKEDITKEQFDLLKEMLL